MIPRPLLRTLCAAALTTLALTVPQAATAAPPSDCKITSPPEGWPGGGIPGYNTRLHHGHNTDWNNQVRPIGDVRAIMLFVDFPNATAGGNAAPYNNPNTYYDHLLPRSADFFRTASYGRFRLAVDAPRKWYRMSRNDSDYGFGYIVAPEVQARYIQEAIRLADRDVDFSQYSHVYVVPPRNARAIPYSPEWNDYRGVVNADGKYFKNGVTFGQDAWHWGYKILNHETGHDLGLPELYNATGSGSTFRFTGDWGVMGNIAGEAPDFLAWEKWKLGWLDDDQITCVRGDDTATQTLSPVETPGGTKAAVVRTGQYTAWVAEVRQRTGVDAAACDKGVLIYKVDVSIANGAGSIRVQDAHPSTSVCGEPLNDAAYDLGSGEVSAFYDSASRARVELLSTANGGYSVRVTSGSGSGGTVVYADDFESDKGWQANPNGTDTATAGKWERGDPEATVFSGSTYQRGDTTSGTNDLVTGRLAGADSGTHDVDGGTTSIRSPEITLPAGKSYTLTAQQYLAHANNASAADRLRIRVIAGGTAETVFERNGAATTLPASWQPATADLTKYAGQTVRLLVEATDAAPGSLLEAAVDDIRITQR